MQKHPRKLTCDRCGAKLELEKYVKNGEHFRKYFCPKCGFTQIFKKVRDYYG